MVTRHEPFRVMHAPQGHAIASDLLRIDLRDHSHNDASALVEFLSLPEGQRRLRTHASGVTVAHLSVAALKTLALPVEWRDARPASKRLAEQLEEILSAML